MVRENVGHATVNVLNGVVLTIYLFFILFLFLLFPPLGGLADHACSLITPLTT